VGEHWDAKPVDVDIRGKTDDSEGEEYGELEEDPGLWFGSSFVPLLLDVFVEISAAALFAARLFVQNPLCHLTRIWVGECVQPTLASGCRMCRRLRSG